MKQSANWTQLEYWDDEGKAPHLKEHHDRYQPEEEEDAQWTKAQIEGASRTTQLLVIDIAKEENCQKIIDAHMSKFGKLSVLVNNAAIQEACEDISDIDLGVVEKTFRTNVFSQFAMVKYALPHMRRGSSIINSTSTAAYMSNPMLLDYASTKGAIATFTRGLAQHLAPKEIRVNGGAPGIIWTPLQPPTKGTPAEAMSALGVQEAPLQRPGMPVEMATA